ncbi:Open rectifier potassium channel protein 1 [Amphibalanus amphitrite]|uniref:Open rectifier potassium channel protein 1 n=1 Tax=Amphibalanus amphitrite TaxID=1232801 RepID=A0A6A4WIW3_AMPAM|nr:Open rectifier potassium channel protein 1 [Amphibalanus amphitrite]
MLRWSLAALTVLYLLFGLLLFVLVPAVAFSWLENWNYREAVYYAFVTLSTIGFGDYTAAGPGPSDTAWSTVYKLLLMLWILLGLGYWVLVLDFLQRTLKSKEVLQALQGTSRLMGREAAELRAALTELGVLRPDAAFVPQHSKAALSLVLGVSRSLAGTAPPAHTTAGLPGIHAIGDGLLSALLSALPASPSDSPQAASGGAVNEGCRPADGSQRQQPPGPQ